MLKKINFLDLLLICTLTLSTIGFTLAKTEKTGLNKVIKDKNEIFISIFLQDIHTDNEDLFKVGEKTALTIRNRPYTKLKIIKVESVPQKILIPSNNGSYKISEDPLRANIKDFIVTISDEALVTDDGYALGGNKIKIGNSVELEGFNYRLSGKVINISNDNKPN